jgi:hypothetical protein
MTYENINSITSRINDGRKSKKKTNSRGKKCGETQEAVRSRRRVDNTMSKIKRTKGVQTIIYKALHKILQFGNNEPTKNRM